MVDQQIARAEYMHRYIVEYVRLVGTHGAEIAADAAWEMRKPRATTTPEQDVAAEIAVWSAAA